MAGNCNIKRINLFTTLSLAFFVLTSKCTPEENTTCLSELGSISLDKVVLSEINQTVETNTDITSLSYNISISELCSIAEEIVSRNFILSPRGSYGPKDLSYRGRRAPVGPPSTRDEVLHTSSSTLKHRVFRLVSGTSESIKTNKTETNFTSGVSPNTQVKFLGVRTEEPPENRSSEETVGWPLMPSGQGLPRGPPSTGQKGDKGKLFERDLPPSSRSRSKPWRQADQWSKVGDGFPEGFKSQKGWGNVKGGPIGEPPLRREKGFQPGPSALEFFAFTFKLLAYRLLEKRAKTCASFNGTYDQVKGVCTYSNSSSLAMKSRSYSHLVDRGVSYYISVTGNGMSLIFLLTLIVIFASHKSLRTRPARNITCLAVTMAIAHVIQLIGLHALRYQTFCKSIAVMLHWTFLAVFTWMGNISFDLLIAFAFPFRSGKYGSQNQFKLYNIIAIASPTIIVGVCVVVDHVIPRCIGYGIYVCFIGDHWGMLYGFIVPVILVTVFNVVCLAVTITKMYRQQKAAREMKVDGISAFDEKIRLCIMALKISTLTALGWIFGCLAGILDNATLGYLFLVMTACQGIFVFVAFYCNQQVFNAVLRRTDANKKQCKEWYPLKQRRDAGTTNELSECFVIFFCMVQRSVKYYPSCKK